VVGGIMAVSDPIADMLTRIKNAMMVRKSSVVLPCSKMKLEILAILKNKGFIEDYREIKVGIFKDIEVILKYENDGKTPVVTEIYRVSKPGRRIYTKKDEIPRVLQGKGLVVVSTSKGIMSGDEARKKGLGGEVLLKAW
jgi:small subunit ribosomal protein S8